MQPPAPQVDLKSGDHGVILNDGTKVPFNQLQQYDPQLYSQYVQNLGQPSASLNQTQTSTQATGASIPGIQAESGIKQIQGQQVASPISLSKDLAAKMTLPDAIKKYTANGGMKADDIFKQYLAESPWGMPNETPYELNKLGVTDQAMGKPGQRYTYADMYNTKQALQGIDDLKNKWNSTGTLLKIGIPTASSQGYNSLKAPIAAHIASIIPGAPGGENTAAALSAGIPDMKNPWQVEPGAADQMFDSTKQGILRATGYKPSEIGLPNTQSQQIQKQTSGKDLLNGILNTALPTGGAIVGGIGGGIAGAAVPGADLTGVPEVAGAMAGSGVGGGAGQALADYLTGKKPGADVAVTGGLSAAGEGVGAGLGAILGKVGGALADKVGGNVFNKVVSASPNYVNDVAALKTTANKYGLMNGNTMQGLQQMPKVMSSIGKQIQDGLSQVKTPVNLASVNKSILDDFSKQTSSFENTADFKNAQDYITKRLFSATGNDNPLSSILNPSGNPIAKEGAQTTYSDLYTLKSQVAKDLKPVFKAQSNPAAPTNFTPKQEANLSLWDGLKKVIDQADPNIRQLNDDQHNMFDIAKGFVKDATTRKGGSGVVGDIFDTLAGSMVGGPVGGLATLLAGRAIKSNAGRAVLSKVLQSGITKQGVRAGGALTGSGLGAILGAGQ